MKRKTSTTPKAATKRARFEQADVIVPPAGGPGGPMEIVFSFDTTGSMNSYLDAVRGKIVEMIERLQADIPNLRIAVIAHGDYCDLRSYGYVTKIEDLTDNAPSICEFVKTVGGTGGGDFEECYELVLHEVRTKLSWRAGSQRSLVMIGDAIPHEKSYAQNTLNLDWKEEVEKLYKDAGVHIYAVQCGAESRSEKFFKSLAEKTSGTFLNLNSFNNLFDLLMGVCYMERDVELLNAYEHEVRSRDVPIHKEVEAAFRSLRAGMVKPLDGDTADDDSGCDTSGTKRGDECDGESDVTDDDDSVEDIMTDTTVELPKQTKRLSRPQPGEKRLYGLTSRVAPYNGKMAALYPPAPLDWSFWKIAFTYYPSDGAFVKRDKGRKGYRAKTLFQEDKKTKGSPREKTRYIYEICVESPCPYTTPRRYPVHLFTKTHKASLGKNWETSLLRGKRHIISQIDDVIGQGCDVYIRRAVQIRDGCKYPAVKSVNELKATYEQTYVYPWNIYGKTGRTCHKTMVRLGYTISDECID